MVGFGLKERVILIVILAFFVEFKSVAQSKVGVDLGADLVSSYVWRGVKQAGTSIQPTLGLGYRDFSLGAWASTDIASAGHKEVDFTFIYNPNRTYFALTDYWWDGEGQFRYFSNPNVGNSGHLLEATIGYTMSHPFPLSIKWNTFFLGKGNKKTDGANSYSTFVELAYPFQIEGTDLELSSGFTPWQSVIYGTSGFSFTMIAVEAKKHIRLSDNLSLPLFGKIIFNPQREDVHFVLGISIATN